MLHRPTSQKLLDQMAFSWPDGLTFTCSFSQILLKYYKMSKIDCDDISFAGEYKKMGFPGYDVTKIREPSIIYAVDQGPSLD